MCIYILSFLFLVFYMLIRIMTRKFNEQKRTNPNMYASLVRIASFLEFIHKSSCSSICFLNRVLCPKHVLLFMKIYYAFTCVSLPHPVCYSRTQIRQRNSIFATWWIPSLVLQHLSDLVGKRWRTWLKRSAKQAKPSNVTGKTTSTTREITSEAVHVA